MGDLYNCKKKYSLGALRVKVASTALPDPPTLSSYVGLRLAVPTEAFSEGWVEGLSEMFFII